MHLRRIACVAVLLVASPVWARHSLSAQERRVVNDWLKQHPHYRIASDADCNCEDDLYNQRIRSQGVWRAIPDYHPYIVAGDFNGDGNEDFAVAVIDRSKRPRSFTLLIFNGPFEKSSAQPAFELRDIDLAHQGLFFGPPRPQPYRLILGPFESEGDEFVPVGTSYRLDHVDTSPSL